MIHRNRVLAWSVCLALLGAVPVWANPASDAARRDVRPAGSPRLVDVCFSSRWPRPLDANDPHETFSAAKAFHATRFDWNYPGGSDFIRSVKEKGYVYFGAISAELEGSTDRRGRDKSYKGAIVGNPELDFLAARGDVASDAYADLVRSHVFRILDGGADGIHVDDPGMTYHNAIHNGGGFGDASMRQFPAFLAEQLNAEQRRDVRLPEDLTGFDYARYVRERAGKPPRALEELFLEFHRRSVDGFYRRLRRDADERAGRHVPFACNNWSLLRQEEFPFQEHFDFWIGETSVRYNPPTAKRLYEKIRNAARLGKLQCFSPPNDGSDVIPTREEYVALARKIIATSHACGSCTLVPWDVWRRGSGTPRFFGSVEEFGDLYRLIADNPALFEDHWEVFAAGAGVAPTPAGKLPKDLASISFPGEQVLLTIRAVPGDVKAPIVVHLVDWSTQPQEGSIELDNRSFGHSTDRALPATLILPGSPVQAAKTTLARDGRTVIPVPALKPQGVVVVSPN